MKVLGLSYGFHDSAAALLIDGRIVAAGQEERFTRIKHDARFPHRAIEFCLRQAGISITEVDRIVYYENALKKFDRIVWASTVREQQKSAGGLRDRARALWNAATKADDVPPYLKSVTHSWFKLDKFDAVGKISDELAVSRKKVTYVDHHDSHLAAAFYTSPFYQAGDRHHGRRRRITRQPSLPSVAARRLSENWRSTCRTLSACSTAPSPPSSDSR